MNFGIIAAGEGSRLAQEGVAVPKPLVKINGVPMIGRLVEIFRNLGAENICVIVNEEMTEVREFVEALKRKGEVNIEMVVKSTPSSMHSFAELGKFLRGKGKFIVTTVDTIFREDDFRRYAEAFEADTEHDGMMAMTGFVDDEKPLYIETDDKDEIIAFRDEPWDGARYISGGIYGLTDPALDVLYDCLDRDVKRMRNYQRALVAAGLRLKGFDMGKVLDVDHAGDIVKAEDFLNV